MFLVNAGSLGRQPTATPKISTKSALCNPYGAKYHAGTSVLQDGQATPAMETCLELLDGLQQTRYAASRMKLLRIYPDGLPAEDVVQQRLKAFYDYFGAEVCFIESFSAVVD